MSAQLAQALRDLLSYAAENDPGQGDPERDDPRITAASEALAAHEAAPQQEPDCWAILTPNGSRLVSPDEAKGRKDAYPLYAAPQQAQAPGVSRPFDAVKSFADSVLSMLDERIKAATQAAHPFNDKFGDRPETLVAAKAQEGELREVRWQVRLLGDRALVDLMKFKRPQEAQQAQAPGWQDIATAPKDGTEFWGWRPHGRVQQGVAYRVPRDDCEMWHFAGSSAAVDIAPDLKPTHWMSLPAAPQQGSNT